MKLLISILMAATAAYAQSSASGAWTLTGTSGPSQAALLSISVSPSSPTQTNGVGVTFLATGTFSDGSTQDVTGAALWSSSNTGIALLDTPADPQNVNCVGVGSSVIGAVVGGISGTATLTCTAVSNGENAYCTGSTDSTCFAGAQTDGPAALPTTGMQTDTANTPAPGSTVTVAPGSCSAIQTALNNASCGQTIQVPALNGTAQNTQTCNLTLPAHSCDAGHWIWLVSDQLSNSNFPAEHTRATPCAINQTAVAGYPNYPCPAAASLMPQIQCANSGNQACISAAAGANYYRIIGLDILQPNSFSNDGNGLVDLTNGADHIIIDRSMLHGQPVSCTRSGNSYACSSSDLKNGVQLQNSTSVAVINSWLYDVACPEGTCSDAHAFGGGNGTSASRTYKIYNNLISAAGENFFQGGSGSLSSTIATPADFEIRSNHFFKPVSYALCTGCNGEHVEFKNLLEIKNGQRLLIEGNEFENDWMGWQTDQSGYALVIGARNQNNSVFLTASSDGAGNLTATSGSFGTGTASPVSSSCATPGHCKVTVGNTITTAQTQTDATHVSVSPAPAAGTGLSINQCTAGLNPAAIATDITIRFNEFRNSTNGPEFATVLSDCGDPSLGLTRFTVHDNLIQGINSDLNNASSGNALARCTYVLNAEPATISNYVIEHNTCAMGRSGNFGNSGFDVSQDLTDTTIDGSNGAYITNRTIQNNIGPAGGIFTYASGLYPGGALAGLKQQSCTPPVTGTTCTWTYTRNVLGVGQWTNQINNTPFPTSNLTCNSSSATCFPSGSAFANLFVSYNGPNGQTGYLGDYHLATGNPYAGAGTDGKDIGADIPALLNKLSGVRSDTTYTAANITTTSLPNATHGTAYSAQLSATSASDMQVWRVISGSLPAGLTLSFAGVISGTPSSAGTATFTVQMMDAAQQYATQALTLTVQ